MTVEKRDFANTWVPNPSSWPVGRGAMFNGFLVYLGNFLEEDA